MATVSIPAQAEPAGLVKRPAITQEDCPESVFPGHADLHRADNTADSDDLHKPPHGQGDIVCVEHSNQFTQSQSSLGTKDQVRHGVNQ